MTDLLQQVGAVLRLQATNLQGLFFNPGSGFSVGTLFVALCVAMGFVLLRRRPGKRDVRLAVLLRAFFPRRLTRSPSARADVIFLFLNSSVAVALLAGFFLAAGPIALATRTGLAALFGVTPRVAIADLPARALATVVLFLAYELGYWANHYVSHRIPVIWEFHKVHHTAEVLSPATVYRVHPVDSVIFGNFVAVFSGVAAGVLAYGLGRPAEPFAIGGTNLIFFAFSYLLVHLQHSHFWMAASGGLGRVVISPAHHQLHHSDDPAHHNKNFGSCLAIWDWMFGTLVVPQRRRQRLTFGAGPALAGNHTLMGMLVTPFGSAWRRLGFLPARPEDAQAGAGAWNRPVASAGEERA